MKATAISNGYMTGKVYLIWEIPYEKINYFEVWRNGNMIASTPLGKDKKPLQESYIHTDLEKAQPFVHPCLFDRDFHTNLFRKDSPWQLMYVDEDVQKFQEYEYYVIGTRIDEDGSRHENVESEKVYITAY